MKKTKLIGVFIIALICMAYYSCKKDLYDIKQQPNSNFSVAGNTDSLKAVFLSRNFGSKFTQKINDSLSINWQVNWTPYSHSKVNDSLTYYYFELNPVSLNTKTNVTDKNVKEVNTKRFLVAGKGNHSLFFRIADYFFENKEKTKISAVGKNYSMRNFTGHASYYNLDKNIHSGVYFSNSVKSMDPNTQHAVQVNSTTKTMAEICYNEVTCHYYGICDDGIAITATVGRDFCPPAPTFYPGTCQSFDFWRFASSDSEQICDPDDSPVDPPPVTTPITPPPGGAGTVGGISQIDDPTKKPCPGDPIKLTVVAPSSYTNVNGGRFGDARRTLNGTVRHHYGLDVSAQPNTPLYPVLSGVVVRNKGDVPPGEYVSASSFGNFIEIESTLPSGQKIRILYGHLNSLRTSDLTIGSTVTVGTAIGLTGQTGNAAHVPFPHVHIQASINGQKVNVEPYVRTKFDAQGAAIVTPC